jgi:ABC-type nitrate/sulfonate/bicarbonate transport system permease component
MSSPLPPTIATLITILVGAIPAIIIGLPLGLLLGQVKPVYEVAKRILQIPASVPTVTLLPLLLIILQSNEGNIIVLVIAFFSIFWWVSLFSAMGVRRSQEKKQWWSAIPDITQGIRLGLLVAWSSVIFAEMLGGRGGIGFYIWDAYNAGSEQGMQTILGAIIAITMIAFILDQLIDVIGIALMQVFKSSGSTNHSQIPPQ